MVGGGVRGPSYVSLDFAALYKLLRGPLQGGLQLIRASQSTMPRPKRELTHITYCFTEKLMVNQYRIRLQRKHDLVEYLPVRYDDHGFRASMSS